MGRGKFRGGRRGGGRGGGRGGSGRGGGGWRDRGGDDGRTSYPQVPKANETFQKYYDSLISFADDDERQAFWDALRRELPNSFRFCGSKGHALAVRRLLQDRYIPEIARVEHTNGQLVPPPVPVPWYPDSLAWWMTTPKQVIRKFPPFAAFQKFLVSETSVGNISRQEVVSMIPPLLMDLQPGMTVLDMCAAPGSKAAQLLEMIHRGEEARMRKAMQLFAQGGSERVSVAKDEDETDEGAAELQVDAADDGRATGILIANDSDYKRSHMLVHQLKRLSSPNILVTNHDATLYPSLKIGSDDPKKPQYLKFDRILADVPCSGDGTLRKNANLWKDWVPGSAIGLHVTQIRILVRALQMLKPGGRVVYSTCSMNPVENESVVVSAIERCGGPDKVEIVDCSDQLPLLKRTPGLKEWQIIDKSSRHWRNWQDVEEYARTTEDGVIPSRLQETMFPRLEGSQCSDLPLERCMRVYPHMQDTGGFFITVLHKKEEFKAKPEEPRKTHVTLTTNGAEEADGAAKADGAEKANGEAAAPETAAIDMSTEPAPSVQAAPEPASTAQKRPREDDEDPEDESYLKKQKTILEEPAASEDTKQPRKKPEGPYEEPFKYLATDHEVVKTICDFYKISPRFPTDRYMVRNNTGEPAKAIYYTNALVRDILMHNEGRAVKFIHGGVKMFMKQDAPSAEVCRWRIQAEGMPILHGYVGADRVVTLHKRETLRELLVEMFPKTTEDAMSPGLAEIAPRMREIGMGCCVLRVEPEQGDDFEPMAMPLWKSFQSLNLMLPKEDRSAMLLRIFNDTTPLVNKGLDKHSKKTEGEATNDDAQAVAAAAGSSGEVKADGEDGGEEVEQEGDDAAPAAVGVEDQDMGDYDAEDAPSPPDND